MLRILKSLLKDKGWDERLAVPELREERELIEQIVAKEEKLMQLRHKLESNELQKQLMHEYLKNVKQERENTVALCKAKESEEALEKHLAAVAERESGHMTHEAAKMEKDLLSLVGKQSFVENVILKTIKKLEKFRNQMNWDQRTMDAFIEESLHRHEDTMAIVKYAHQEEQRIKSLSLAIEKKRLEAIQKRKVLDKEMTETLTAQVALEKTTKILQQTHLEVQEITIQWENVIKQMQQRDAEIQQFTLLADANQRIREKEAIIREKKDFLDSQKDHNTEIERMITKTHQRFVMLGDELEKQDKMCSSLQNELEALHVPLSSANTNVNLTRSRIVTMKKTIQDNTKKIEAAKLQNAALEEKLKLVTETTLSKEERAIQMDQFLKDEDAANRRLDVQLHEGRQELFCCKKHLYTLTTSVKVSLADVAKSKTIISGMKRRLKQQEKDISQQQKIMSGQHSKIGALGKQLAQLQGNVGVEVKQKFDIQIATLTKTFEEKKTTATLLSNRTKDTEAANVYLRKEMRKAESEKKHLTEKVDELMLRSCTNDQELKRLRLKKQESIVDYNILKVEVNRVRGLLYNRADTVLSLERERLELLTAIQEREEEISVCRGTLGQKLRFSEQDRQRLSAELNEKLVKADLLKKRFEVVTLSMKAPEGEKGTLQAYYIAQAALKKGELMEKRETLHALVCRTERENRALGNTMQLFVNSNSSMRKSLNKAAESSPRYQEKLQLEQQLRDAEDTLKDKKRQVEGLRRQIQEMNDTLASLLEEEQFEEDNIEQMQYPVNKLKRELTAQQQKLDRATKQCSKLIKQIRSAKNTKAETFEEKDIKLRELREFNRKMNNMLHEAMENTPDLRPLLTEYFMLVDLSVPTHVSTPSSQRSSKTNSVRSSASTM